MERNGMEWNGMETKLPLDCHRCATGDSTELLVAARTYGCHWWCLWHAGVRAPWHAGVGTHVVQWDALWHACARLSTESRQAIARV